MSEPDINDLPIDHTTINRIITAAVAGSLPAPKRWAYDSVVPIIATDNAQTFGYLLIRENLACLLKANPDFSSRQRAALRVYCGDYEFQYDLGTPRATIGAVARYLLATDQADNFEQSTAARLALDVPVSVLAKR